MTEEPENEEAVEKAPAVTNGPSQDYEYPSGIKLAMLMISIFIGAFLVALVRSQAEKRSKSDSTTRRLTLVIHRTN